MVVEDETIVRLGLRYMMDWNELDINWKAEASGGEEALELLEKEEIHIVMTDIRMPGMDGLTLARQIKERYSWIQIIFFSSFEDFPYVKEAVRIGVVDYLHKPTMEPEEIAAALRKARANLEEQQAATPAGYTDKERESFLLEWLEGERLPEGMEERVRRFGLRTLLGAGVQLAILHIEGEVKPELARFMSFRYYLEEYAVRQWGGLLVSRGQCELIWLLPRSGKGHDEEEIHEYLKQLEQGLSNMLSLRMAYTYTGIRDGLEELPEAYRTAAAQPLSSEGGYSGIVRLATGYIDQFLLKEVTLARIAEEVHVSVSHLSRVFLKETGQHFNEYVTAKKMLLARKMLRESNLKVYEVAEQLGYANPHYFSKLFKDDIGMTPLEFRNQ